MTTDVQDTPAAHPALTVRQLVGILNSYPPDAQVAVRDAQGEYHPCVSAGHEPVAGRVMVDAELRLDPPLWRAELRPGALFRVEPTPLASAPDFPWHCDRDCRRAVDDCDYPECVRDRAIRAAPAAPAVQPWEPGTWYQAASVDDMQAFYRARLPAIREAAREHGYAIGVHGSERRDFDLIACAWREGASDIDTLAHAIARAACGITRDGAYEWTEKPLGRRAVSIPVCWTSRRDVPNDGHIDLSVAGPDDEAPTLPASAEDKAVYASIAQRYFQDAAALSAAVPPVPAPAQEGEALRTALKRIVSRIDLEEHVKTLGVDCDQERLHRLYRMPSIRTIAEEALRAAPPPVPAPAQEGEAAQHVTVYLHHDDVWPVFVSADTAWLDSIRGRQAKLYTHPPATTAAVTVPVAPMGLTDDALAFALAVAAGDDPHHLIWEGNPPEPWGEVWNRYLPQARDVLKALAAAPTPVQQEMPDA